MPDNELESKFMFVKPEYVGYWSYQIDNQKRYMISEEDLYPYVKPFLKDSKEWAKVVEVMSRHQPFMVLIKEQTVRELHPKENTQSHHRTTIVADLSRVMRGMEGEGTFLDDRKERARSIRSNEDGIDRLLRNSIRSSYGEYLPNALNKARLK